MTLSDLSFIVMGFAWYKKDWLIDWLIDWLSRYNHYFCGIEVES